MRLHTDLTAAEVRHLTPQAKAAVLIDGMTEHRSRTGKARGLEVKLTGTSNRARNDGSGEAAATWDEWGIFLAALYEADPGMIVGGSLERAIYRDGDDFHWKTGDRYRTLTGADQHRQHRWTREWDNRRRDRMVMVCSCGAELRRGA